MAGGARWLVVNADDLGRTPGINAGVFEAHRHGIVTSATLMVGCAAAEAAARSLAEHPELGVGLHVTLTGTAPVLPAARVPTLVGGDGRFPTTPEGIREPHPRELRAEIEAQLVRFVALVGRPPTHLDSHHHSHRHPAVRDVLLDVARERRLPVRSTSKAIGRRLRELGIATTDHFVERFFGATATVETLLAVVDELVLGSTELMCHPGRIDAELRAGSSYVDEREREIAALCDPAVRSRIDALGIRLARFDEACAS